MLLQEESGNGGFFGMSMNDSRWRDSHDRAPTYDAPPVEARIPRAARTCYELFCDVRRMPEWMPMLKSVSIRTQYRDGRPCEVALLASLKRATVGYNLTYTYRERDYHVAWCSPADSGVSVAGWAHFRSTGSSSCVMVCDLWLRPGGALSSWNDTLVEAHAPFAVASRFRSFATRRTRALSEEVTVKRVIPVRATT